MKFVYVVIAFLLALLVGQCHKANAQTVETTPNLVTNTWTGVVPSTSTGGGFSGGHVPEYNSSTNTVMFGYNQATVAQTFAINQALQGSGVQIGGYNYSWQYLNNSSTGGTLSSTIRLSSSGGSTLESYNYAMNTIADGWRTMQGTQNFNQQYGVSNVGNLSIEFTGKDARWWAGLYGPQVRDVNLSLNYTVDPCTANPLYSPSCPGYNNVITSQNIYAQSYAINQALNLSGSGVQINGFQYGYNMYVGGDWCSAAILFWCTNWSSSSMAIDVNVTSNTGSSLYSQTHNHNTQNSGGSFSYSYVFPSQRTPSSMGNFSLSARGVGSTALYSSWSNWQYTPDPCTVNPLSSTSCSGYQAAYQTQMCTANPLYNPACPGYAQAMFTQQCSANQLSDPACPGYASAYLTYQCSINPLYSTTCAGYETAYHDQQCSVNPLFARDCNGYAAAYKTQQCTANPLYATDCPGYEQAYLNSQCIIDSLYSTRCEGYATAYAIKYLVTNIDSTAVNQSLSNTAATKANDPTNTVVATNTASTSISSDGTVSTGVSTTGDTNVDKAIAAPKTTSTSGSQPAAAVQLMAPPPAAVAQRQEQKQDEKKADNKPEGGNDKPSGGQSQAQSNDSGGSKPAAPTARQELQARREAAAKADAVEKGKNLAGEMGKAADMEAQKQIQNVVIQAMGFTPGFDAYSKQMVVQQQFYKPYTIYGGQKTIDNRANLRMFGGTDKLHNEMVDSQYNRGN